MDAAAVVVRQVDARLVSPAFEDEPSAIRRNLRLPVDEFLLRHPEERGDAADFVIAHAHDPVLDPAARPATQTLEIRFANLQRTS